MPVGAVDTEIRIIDPSPADIVVTNVSVPAVWRVGSGVPIEVTLENRGDITGNGTLSVPVNGTDRETTVPVDGSEKRTVTRTAWFRAAGDYTVTVAGEGTRIRIVEPGNVSLSPLPGRAPPNTTLVVTARDRAGAVVPGLRFRLGGEQFRTGADGRVRIRVPSDPGQYRLESRIGERIVHNRGLEVTTDTERSFLVTLQMRPEQVVFPNTTEGIVTAYNPWGSSLSRELVVQRERESVLRRTVELTPGDATIITTSVDPAATSATQRVRVLIDGRVLGEATFTVEASDRLVAVLGRAGLYEPGSGLLRSLDELIGNFQVLQVSLVVLALLMGIGTTATVVIQATHARRQTIGVQRVTGAAPRDVVGTILGDGLRVGAIASVIGVVGAYLGLTVLVRLGYAVIFGVRIPPLLNPWLVLGVLGGALVVVAASSLLAAAWVLRVSPGALVTASTQRVPDQDDGPPSRGTEGEG
jgi:hypothetical protein